MCESGKDDKVEFAIDALLIDSASLPHNVYFFFLPCNVTRKELSATTCIPDTNVTPKRRQMTASRSSTIVVVKVKEIGETDLPLFALFTCPLRLFLAALDTTE